ncbi:MAG: aminopeptidase P N-terminal domain-containing protein [Planctomycetota bacterium]
MQAPTIYRENRARFLALLAERGAAAIIPTASAKIRNHDSEYRFRPDSDFWYLSGFAEPDSVLVLLPGSANNAARSILFLREKKREEEVWTGLRLGVEAAPGALGVDAAHPIAELWTRLPELLKGFERIVYRSGLEETRDRALHGLLAKMRAQVRSEFSLPSELIDPSTLLHELRLFKTPAEIALMRKAAAITTEAHVAAMRETRPGMRENEIDALLTYTFLRRGASGAAYGNIVAGGANACILHYHENDQELRAGDLLLIDAGAEFDCYASDVTRTFPVDGQFSAEQRALYEVVLEAQLTAIAQVRPGNTFQSVHEVAVRVLCEGLARLGLLSGTPAEIVKSESYKRFYMHRTGHWLGLDVHDCGAYVVAGASRPMQAGQVLTVEPGLYIAPEDERVEPRWRGIGIRIEDDLLVTATGHEVLTREIPKSVEEIERACARPRSAAGVLK